MIPIFDKLSSADQYILTSADFCKKSKSPVKLLQVAIPLAISLIMLTPATALAVYDFNALTPSPTNPTINGQDGWEVSTFYGTTSVPSNGYVKSAWGADGSQALYCNPPNGPSGTQMSRPNDASLGMPNFTGPNLQAIETDIYPQCWGVHFGVGYDNNSNGQIDLGTDTGTEVGLKVALGNCFTNQWGAGSTTANFSNPFVGQWGRIRMIIDTTANSGQGSGCLLYKLPYNAATWTPVSTVQQVNLNLNSAATDARKAANWNRIFFACSGADNSGIDNVAFETFTPPSDITLSSTAINENSPANSVIGTLSASPTSSYTYTLVAGTGDTDNGSFTISGSNLQINASPDYETKNSYSLRVKATRDDGGSCVTPFEKVFTVTITNLNDNAPIVTGSSFTTNEDTAYSGGTLPVGSDADGDSLSYSLVSNGTVGTATITNTGAFTYTPNANQNGTDSFTFKAYDGMNDSNTATMTVTVNSVNDPPSFTASNPPAVLENSGTHTVTSWATFNPGPNDTDGVLVYTVSNLTNSGLFSSPPSVNPSGTLIYTLATNQSGSSNFDVTLQDNGGTANGGIDLSTTATFTLNVSAPEINLSQAGTTLSSGSSYNFGAILIGQSSPAITFTIDNLGSSNLLLSGSPKLAVTGTDASEFRVTDNTSSSISPGGQTTFTITFTPTVMGSRTALLTIANNDGDESHYTLTLQGVGLTSDISVKQGATEIPSGGSFDVGPAAVGYQAHYPFTIDNVGNSDLILNGSSKIRVSGANAGEFSIDDTATINPLPAGASTTLVLNFMPTTLGNKTATLTIANNDWNEGNYTITVIGSAEPHKDLQVMIEGSGQGTVTSEPEGMNCEVNQGECLMSVIEAPRWVTLTATPAIGSELAGWTGDTACQADGKVFVLENTSCTATFNLKSYTLTVEKNAPGATVTGEGINCPDTCQATYPYGTIVKLAVGKVPLEWQWVGWGGSCDSQGQVTITGDKVCRAQYREDPKIPSLGDGNGDGQLDAHQANVMSLADKVAENYITLEVNPECVIADGDTVLAETQPGFISHYPAPQGLMYFDIQCSQATVTMYFHGLSQLRRNFKFRKFGPTTPGDINTTTSYEFPAQFGIKVIEGKPVVTATYTLTDGELGDSTGIDGHIVDPGGIVVK